MFYDVNFYYNDKINDIIDYRYYSFDLEDCSF